jgi:hypothetical protein
VGIDANDRTVRINFIADGQQVGAVLKDMSGRVRDVKGRFVSAGKQAELFEEQARRAAAAGVTGFKRVGAEVKSATSSLRAAAKSGRAFISGMKDVGLVGIGLSTIVSAGREAIQMLDELATEALEVEQVSRNLAFGIGAAAESTEGLVDNLTLARNANKAFALGVAQDSQEFAALAGAAQKIAQAQGVSAQKLVEQAVVGIGRKSAARLDDLGILLNQNKAERIYAKSLGKTANELTLLEKEEAFQKAALIEIQKAGDRAAASIDGFALTVAKGKIELANAKQGFLGFDDTIGRVREAMRALTDEELERLRFGEVADEASAAGIELNKTLEEWGVNLRDVRGAADDLGVSFQDLIKGQKELREVQAVEDTIKGVEILNQAQITGLEQQADEAEFLAKLGAAQGENEKIVNARMLEGLELRRDAAELQFAQTQSAADEAALLALQRDIQLAQASAGRRGGGRGASAAERLLAVGESRVALLEQEARLSGLLAETDQARADAAEQGARAEQTRLQLEREALEVTKARGQVAGLELAAKKQALDAEITIIDFERRLELRERETQLLTEQESLFATRASITVNTEVRRLELLGRTAEAEELIFAQREAEIIARPPETELERIAQKEELAQLTHERDLARLEEESKFDRRRADERERFHELELKRIEEKRKKQQDAIAFTGNALRSGFQLAGQISAAGIKDDDKRARHALRVRGIEAIAVGALETVKAVAAFASFNVPEGLLHTAAAALGFAQGGIMLSGNIPGKGGGASAGGAAAAAPRVERETSGAATIVESLPAADREPRRQATGQQQGGGNTVNIENLNAMGSIDRDFAENLSIELDNVGNGLERAS